MQVYCPLPLASSFVNADEVHVEDQVFLFLNQSCNKSADSLPQVRNMLTPSVAGDRCTVAQHLLTVTRVITE